MGQDGARPGSMERGTFYKQSRYIAHLNENFYRIIASMQARVNPVYVS